jgi:hypothetical protein
LDTHLAVVNLMGDESKTKPCVSHRATRLEVELVAMPWANHNWYVRHNDSLARPVPRYRRTNPPEVNRPAVMRTDAEKDLDFTAIPNDA